MKVSFFWVNYNSNSNSNLERRVLFPLFLQFSESRCLGVQL